jgi:hypothetical protein
MKTVGAAFLVALSFLGHMRAAEAEDVSAEAKKAESLNTEGKKLVSRLDLDGAAERFRDAWQAVRDPRFAFNLCYTLEKSGKLYEARVACREVLSAKDQRLASKATELLKEIEKDLPQQPNPVGPPTNPQQPNPVVVGPSPYPQPVTPAYPAATYRLIAPKTTTVSYFTHVLLADAASWTVIALSAGAESDGFIGLGVAGLLLGGPIVHLMQNNARGAWLSTGARFGMPLGGALVGSSACDDGGDCLGSIIGGAVLGYGGALLLDWFVFSKKQKTTYPTQGMALPTLELKHGGAIAGISLQL